MRVYQRIDSVTVREAFANPNISDDLAAAAAGTAAGAATGGGDAAVTAGDAAAGSSASGSGSTDTDVSPSPGTMSTHKTRTRLPEDGLVLRHSGYAKGNECMNASRVFFPPCTTMTRYSEKDKGKTSMLIYFVPTRPGGGSCCNHLTLAGYPLTSPSHHISHHTLSPYSITTFLNTSSQYILPFTLSAPSSPPHSPSYRIFTPSQPPLTTPTLTTPSHHPPLTRVLRRHRSFPLSSTQSIHHPRPPPHVSCRSPDPPDPHSSQSGYEY